MTDSTNASTAADLRTERHAATGGDLGDGGRSTVLLHVEPDTRSAELLSAFAESFAPEFTIRSIDGMEAALDAANAVDCVVTEQRLPDGSGVELVDRLRERGIEVPVVFHTTCREDETERRALEAGADAYFSKRLKPRQYDRIFERLRGCLRGDARSPGTAAPVSDAMESASGASSLEE